MNFFDHKDLGNHLLQLYTKVVKHPVYVEELGSVQLIVNMLNKERNQMMTDTASLDGTQPNQERHGTWEEMTRKSSKKNV